MVESGTVEGGEASGQVMVESEVTKLLSPSLISAPYIRRSFTCDLEGGIGFHTWAPCIEAMCGFLVLPPGTAICLTGSY